MTSSQLRECAAIDISDQDVVAAIRAMRGYIDITPADFREVYRVAYALARDRMRNALKAADIMRHPVHAIAAEDDLIAAATLLAEKGISGAPVIDRDGRIVGVLSERVSAMNYFEKMKGHTQSPPDVGVVEILWSWVGGFLGIAAVGLIHFKLLDQTGLMLIIGGDAVHRLGYLYVLMPAGLGAVVLLLVALLVNNLAPNRRYPEFW